jgi:hypothetical protein
MFDYILHSHDIHAAGEKTAKIVHQSIDILWYWLCLLVIWQTLKQAKILLFYIA